MKRTDGDKADARAPSYTRRWMRLCVCVCVCERGFKDELDFVY